MRSLKYQDSEVCVLRLKTKRQKETMFPRKCERCASLPVYLLLEGLLEIPILLDVTFSECGAHFEVSLGKQQIGRQREQQKEGTYGRNERKQYRSQRGEYDKGFRQSGKQRDSKQDGG